MRSEVLVDLINQHQGLRINIRKASDESLNVGRQQGCRHPLPGHIRDREEGSAAWKIDHVKVVAAHGTEGLVKYFHFVAHQIFKVLGLECLLDLLCGNLVSFKLGLANNFRGHQPVHDALAKKVKQEHTEVEDELILAHHINPDLRARQHEPDRVPLDQNGSPGDGAFVLWHAASPVVEPILKPTASSV